MDWEWLCFFFSVHSNRKINIIYMSPIVTEKIIFVTSGLHLTSVFSAEGMFSTVWVAQRPSPQSLKKRCAAFLHRRLYYNRATFQGFDCGIHERTRFKMTHPPFEKKWHQSTTFNTRFKQIMIKKTYSYGNSCNLWWLRSLGVFLSLDSKVWAWEGLKWSESEPCTCRHHWIRNACRNRRLGSPSEHLEDG